MRWKVLGVATAVGAAAGACSGERLECETCESGCGGTGASVAGGGTGGATGGAYTGGAYTGGVGGTGGASGESGASGAAGESGSTGVAGEGGAAAAAGAAGSAGAAGAGGEPITSCWAYTYGTALDEEGGGILRTDEGWSWVKATTCDGADDCDTVLMRVDEDGTLLSARSYGGSERDFINFRRLDDGGLIGTGFTQSFGANEWDAWVVRLDSAGDIVWQKALDGSDFDYLTAARPTPDGGFLLVGQTSSFGEPDGWLVQLTATGDVVWQRRYDMRDEDRLNSIVPVLNGYIATGYTIGTSGEMDGWAIGLTQTGQFMWSRRYGGDGWDILGGVRVLESGTLLVVGGTDSAGAGGRDGWLLELDQTGAVVSSRAYGTDLNDSLGGWRLDSDGSLLAAGSTWDDTNDLDDLMLVRVAPTGEVDWARAYGEPDVTDVGRSAGLANVFSASTGSWGAGGDDILLLRPLSDGTCPGLTHREVALQVEVFLPTVRAQTLVASNTDAVIRDTDAVPVELTLTQASVF